MIFLMILNNRRQTFNCFVSYYPTALLLDFNDMEQIHYSCITNPHCYHPLKIFYVIHVYLVKLVAPP